MKKQILRIFSAILCMTFLFGTLSGCRVPDQNKEEKKISIVTTVFPIYDWVRQILGDRADDCSLTMLLDSGADLHSYQPTADDMVAIASCDIFLYVGGESDEWVSDALAETVNSNMIAINLIETLGDAVKEEEIVEGMEHDHDHEEDHDHDENGPEYDEHVWLSLRNAATLCSVIAERLGELDATHKDAYAANAAAYTNKLADLDARYEAVVSTAPCRTVLFGDRFPFRYLTDDYGLSYYAAFSGCSAESEASFETVVFLANKVDELGLDTVLTIESGDGRIAQTVVENTQEKSAQILQMDSLQSTTLQDAAAGASYIGAMEENLKVLRQALQIAPSTQAEER